MATLADQRLLELLEKWLKSLELHLKYSPLDDAAYSTVQPWPKHQRPGKWIIDLAQQKCLALQAQVQNHVQSNDATFAESLELMLFLSNLLAADHIERFIPLASLENERPPDETPVPAIEAAVPARSASPAAKPTTVRPPQSARAAQGARAPQPTPADPAAATATREMPRFAVEERPPTEVKPAPKAATRVAAPKTPASKNTAAKPAKTAEITPAANGKTDPRQDQVIADAARLVQWGRKWYELAELIAGMADRPPLADVRRMLKDNKTVIEKKAGRG